jgi:hypothetical protein
MYLYVPGTYRYMNFGTAFFKFWKGTNVHIRTIAEVGVPDYFAGLPSPADLPAGDSCTGTLTDPIHTT